MRKLFLKNYSSNDKNALLLLIGCAIIATLMIMTGCKTPTEVECVARVAGTSIYKTEIEGRIWYICDGKMYLVQPADSTKRKP